MGTKAENVETVRLHAAAEMTLDIGKVMDTVSAEPFWDVWPYMRLEGRKAVEAWYTRQIAHFYPRMSAKRGLNQFVTDDTVTNEAEYAYENLAGVRLLSRAVAIFNFDGDKVLSERIHFTGEGFQNLFRDAYEGDEALFKIPGVSRYSCKI